jgi:hypothetical protein
MEMKRDWLMVISIPIIFIVGILLFFLLIPPELMTIINFIAYASSLSTIVMVLVYVFTTSRQLRAMQSQLDEMQYSRDVQVQPLLYFDKLKMIFEAPKFYLDPATEFKKVEFACRVHFYFSISNIGNGPAVAVDFIPNLALVMPKDNRLTKLVEYTYDERIECVSLKKEDSKDVSLMFIDDENKFIESVLGRDVVLHLHIIFKNVLGMPFKEEVSFRVLVYEPELTKKIESCVKAVRTYEIDFTEDISEFEKLIKSSKDEEARKKLMQMREKSKSQLGGLEECQIPIDILSGSFSITPISRAEYDRIIAEKKRVMADYIAKITKEK